MDDLEEQISLYEAIIDVNYEYWITEHELDVDKEDFRLKVDLTYRMRFQKFRLAMNTSSPEWMKSVTKLEKNTLTMKPSRRSLQRLQSCEKDSSRALRFSFAKNRWLTSKNTHRTAASSARISESSENRLHDRCHRRQECIRRHLRRVSRGRLLQTRREGRPRKARHLPRGRSLINKNGNL